MWLRNHIISTTLLICILTLQQPHWSQKSHVSGLELWAGENFVYWMGSQARFTITEPAHARQILSDSERYQKPYRRPDSRDVLANGLTTLNGADWQRHRRITNPAFLAKYLKVMFPFYLIYPKISSYIQVLYLVSFSFVLVDTQMKYTHVYMICLLGITAFIFSRCQQTSFLSFNIHTARILP